MPKHHTDGLFLALQIQVAGGRLTLPFSVSSSMSESTLPQPRAKAIATSSLLGGRSRASLKKQAMIASAWTIGGAVINQVLHLGSHLVLAQLLFPEAFGIIALVGLFVGLVGQFSDIGVGPNIIQNKRGDDPRFLNTAWTFQAIKGLGIWVCLVAIAHPIARIYNEPSLASYLPVMGLSAIIGGITSTYLVTLNRHLQIAKLTLIQLTATVVGIAVTITWALLSPTVWALVAGSIAGSLTTMIISHLMPSRMRNRFCWDPDTIRSLLGFGKWIFLNTLVGSLATHMDKLILGKLIPLELLGIYAVAHRIPYSIEALINRINRKVILPVISRRNELPRAELRSKILRHRAPAIAVVAVGLGVLASCVDQLIIVIYDHRYHEAAWMAPILVLGLWPSLLSATVHSSLVAVGQPQYRTFGSFVRLIMVAAGLYIGFHLFGLPGVVVVVALVGSIPRYIAAAWGASRERLSTVVQDAKATALLVLVVVGILAVRLALGWELSVPDSFGN